MYSNQCSKLAIHLNYIIDGHCGHCITYLNFCAQV
uniref:Uncharacterized protein n=1 Tax=Arundo donax TaxID=35708 RepID=A0A0A9C1W3_ARUDO